MTTGIRKSRKTTCLRTTGEPWRRLQIFLRPFYRATLETEGDIATLDRTVYTMDILVRQFRRSKEKGLSHPLLLSCILTAWYTFDKYYSMTDVTSVYAAAIILQAELGQHISPECV
ncbi:hypothetical protein POJ06DRAFT_40604 [Lipomyces tetrasporus]|uniref:Uncharacterized protein n=1 Tax=Lipomyces tetrasporus TaxID=54092 RepID=A0AAD7QKW9_9ASCO|nr:uncharacterized protein POJ06DRAFT_40604 [Lipomyces tetrasporus]KAJ8097167.1 hypothetical protein POJ06DRAFT_40604 [Lipomyces tetrasporus]